MKKSILRLAAAAFAALTAAVAPQPASACSRVVYHGLDSLFVVGRSLDWKSPIPTDLYVYPRGMHKVSDDTPGAFSWTSLYGAVYAVSYDGGVTEGMNEKGLVINGLFCKGTVYGNAQTADRPPLSLAVFVMWLLDTNATTDEVVAVLREHNFNLGGATFDHGTSSTLHWGITDRSGRCAILEFDNGNVEIYEGDSDTLPMLTNDPTYPSMRAINDYWLAVGGTNMLPGTVRSSDRFVRGWFFRNHVERTADPSLAVSITRSIIEDVSVPYTYTVSGEANVSSTQWRSYANLRDLRYYWDVVTNLGVFYIDLTRLDLYPGAPVLKLTCADWPELAGCANNKLRQAKPFTPMY